MRRGNKARSMISRMKHPRMRKLRGSILKAKAKRAHTNRTGGGVRRLVRVKTRG